MDVATLKKRMKNYKTEAPQLWDKCPKCHEMIYAKEFVDHNKCPECNYTFPFPYKKLWEFKKFIRSGKKTSEEIKKFILKTNDTIVGAKASLAFMKASLQAANDYLAYLRAMKKQDEHYKLEFERLDKDEEFQKFLNMGPPQTKADPINMKKCKEGMKGFNKRFLHN